ncbi:hypothetical protein H0H92_000860 [Tricholoma furcatifolium]|nr:hypothetical protein H0H92_000860 [Tricholoma furcatifolium]
MTEIKKSTSAKSKAKSSNAPRQKTLHELFFTKVTPIPVTPQVDENLAEAAQEGPTHADPFAPTSRRDEEELVIGPVVEQFRQTSLEPRPVHPFFLKPTPQAPPLEGNESIVITDDEASGSNTPIELKSLPIPDVVGSQNAPIIVESSPVLPSRPPPKIAASKPLAPIFSSRKVKAPPLPSTAQSPEVVILELPEEAPRPKKLAPLFAPRLPKAAPLAPSKSRTIKSKELNAPYPDKDSLHVRGPQRTFISSSTVLPHRINRSGTTTSLPADTEVHLKQFLDKDASPPSVPYLSFTSLDRDSYLNTIPDEHRSHPGISRLISTPSSEGSPYRLWTDTGRPTCAAEVLGNENNAIYLRDWIKALEVQLTTISVAEPQEGLGQKRKGKAKADLARGTKRPRTVIRAVEKRRGRKKRRVDSDDDDDWIVYGSDDFSLPPSSPIPWNSSPGPTPPESVPLSEPFGDPEVLARQAFDPLTNTILLTGPPGSGKTAAVYACAEELGWDVFEVYPGIGRRSGPGIDNLIGDAGKNHHVGKSRLDITTVLETSDPFSFFTKEGRESDGLGDSVETDSTNVELHSNTNTGIDTSVTVTSFRQSLILLEEVDILFKEDTGFWSAVTNFIKESRRPVICTCNDVSLVPKEDLPLQTVLTFHPCAPSLAVSYLQALCSAEGHYTLTADAILRLYRDSASKRGAIDLPDIPNPAISEEESSMPDLRRTINHLQFLCTSASRSQNCSGWPADEGDTLDSMCDWNQFSTWDESKAESCTESADQTTAPLGGYLTATRHADLVSFLDAYVVRHGWDSQEGLALSVESESTNDDEVGYTMLRCALEERYGDETLYDRDTDIASAAMWHSRVGRRREPTSVDISPCRTRELFRARVDHQLEIGRGLAGIVPLTNLLMRRRLVDVDYLSWIRTIVAAEDVWERIFLQGQRSGRMTRNSQTLYERVVEVGEDLRRALERTRLVGFVCF